MVWSTLSPSHPPGAGWKNKINLKLDFATICFLGEDTECNIHKCRLDIKAWWERWTAPHIFSNGKLHIDSNTLATRSVHSYYWPAKFCAAMQPPIFLHTTLFIDHLSHFIDQFFWLKMPEVDQVHSLTSRKGVTR